MASINDVALVSGVSKSTVSRFINKNGYVSKDAQAKIKAAIQKLDYEPNSLGRNLKYQSSKTLAICVPMVFHPFFAKFIQAVENEAYKSGYKLLVTDSDNDREREEQFIKLVYQNEVDGIIFVTHNEYESFNHPLPIVSVDRYLNANIPIITSDNYEATYAALVDTYNSGARKIGFIGGKPLIKSEVIRRYQAYQDFIKEYGLTDYSYYVNSRHGEELKYAQMFVAQNWPLEAIFATSDAYAFALNQAFSNTKKPLIISYDGILSEWVKIPVYATIKQDVDAMAKMAVKVLIAQINEETILDRYVIPTKFIKEQ